ncbi:LysM peptidoglycan-binding domain-containing protein [Peribacillus loiseleuriae]|uniref:LysM domain-containing protein n=1 Tax=Peribacillus loiseleuriae TaxID=1679170 RepID=A0A0K9GRB5_9BACI|nr:LysM peptidoglycan-binding domain-containing protein [Peribacillus loiseleuriae]KMY49239.1 hypothetical protein AC625_06640 [Peribacillus loiseleuriae]
MAYVFYLDKLPLPVTPSRITMSIMNQNKTINLINHGEVNILKAAGLTEIEFKATIPQLRYPYAIYKDGFKDAAYYLEFIEKLKINQKPFQFIVTRTSPSGKYLFDTNLTVSLEDYSIDEDAEEGLDLVISFKLKQFKSYSTKKFVIKKEATANSKAVSTTATNRPTTNKPAAKTYTVQKGDSLFNICKKYLGEGNKYKEIAKLNKLSDPSKIYPGQIIKLS